MTTWAEISARAGRNDMPYLLVTQWLHIDKGDRLGAVHQAWTMAEWPEQCAPAQIWESLFTQVGYGVDGQSAPEGDPNELVTLYRGCIPGRLEGMSWTWNPETALWFAKRFGDEGQVYQIRIPRSYILAQFVTARGEDEAVVATSELDMEAETRPFTTVT